MEAPNDQSAQWREALSRFWLRRFFWLCAHAPALLTAARPLICAAAFAFSPAIRRGTRCNARRVLGPDSTRHAQNRLARATLNSFYLFCCDVGFSRGKSLKELLSRIDQVEGRENYQRARALRRGMIVVTAHMGSFEVALAALREMEEHVHVLFRRDAIGEFERQRSELRGRLGVSEVTVDQGWTMWISLRQALLDDQVVVIQGDRVLPGQKGQRVPFLGGQMELPASPIKLAIASHAPIVPIFSVRTPRGKIKLMIEAPIEVGLEEEQSHEVSHPALLKLARVIETQIRAFPDQWLLLQQA